jgi:hypothetical protein
MFKLVKIDIHNSITARMKSLSLNTNSNFKFSLLNKGYKFYSHCHKQVVTILNSRWKK